MAVLFQSAGCLRKPILYLANQYLCNFVRQIRTKNQIIRELLSTVAVERLFSPVAGAVLGPATALHGV